MVCEVTCAPVHLHAQALVRIVCPTLAASLCIVVANAVETVKYIWCACKEFADPSCGPLLVWGAPLAHPLGVAEKHACLFSFTCSCARMFRYPQVAACLWALARLGCSFDPAWLNSVPRRLLKCWLREQQQHQQWQWHQKEQGKGQVRLATKELALLMWACERWGLGEEV
eukprot:scaffold67133_cov21-Tisochrysis_lutea.AAC.1